MDEIWLVQKAAPNDVVEWLSALAQVARAEQSQHQFRSQLPVGEVGAVEIERLPLPTRSRARAAGAIYARSPGEELPFGEILVLALMSPEPPLESLVAGRPFVVEVASDPRFPLMGDEVTWHFVKRFPHNKRLEPGRRSGTLLWINRLSRTPSTGAPVLACNLWLEEQLLRLEHPSQRRSLYKPWLERYRAVRGLDPVDPERSFRAAVKGCERRLRKRGREPEARGGKTKNPSAPAEG